MRAPRTSPLLALACGCVSVRVGWAQTPNNCTYTETNPDGSFHRLDFSRRLSHPRLRPISPCMPCHPARVGHWPQKNASRQPTAARLLLAARVRAASGRSLQVADELTLP